MKRKFCGCYNNWEGRYYRWYNNKNWRNWNPIEKGNELYCGNCKKEIHFDTLLMFFEEKILRKKYENKKCSLIVH